MGPQGSGKGTQAQCVSRTLHIPSFSMGQLLRDEVARQSPIGQQVAPLLNAGELVPASLAVEVLRSRLSASDAQNGFILDGFPRNQEQYDAFQFMVPTHVVVLELSDAAATERLSRRLTCNQCGQIYSMDDRQEGDACSCGGRLIHRKDDRAEAISRRLEIYHQKTKPIIESYDKQGLVHRVSAQGSVQEVHDRIIAALGLRPGSSACPI